MNVQKELAALQRMTPKQLRERYAEVFGEPSHSGNKQFLVKRIIWRLQALAEGNIEERMARIRAKAMLIANDADLRVRPPRDHPPPPAGAPRTRVATLANGGGQGGNGRDPRLPMPGAQLTRQYKGRTVAVTVLADGFEYEGEAFASLSAVAKHVTGSHTNGYLFFNLTDHPSKRRARKA